MDENQELQLIEEEVELTESVLEKDTLTDVLFLGKTSRNGRIYTEHAMQEALSLYDNIPVYINHSSKERQLNEHFGTTQNVRLTEKGIVGSIKALTTHPMFDTIKEAYDNKTNRIGMSHDAKGLGTMKDGIATINKITSVNSLDIVTKSATTQNLRESESPTVVEEIAGVGEASTDKTIKLTEQVTTLSLTIESLQADIKILKEQIETSNIKVNVDKISKWLSPSSIPLTESESVIPKENLGKWLTSK